jgi:hypothetical protein
VSLTAALDGVRALLVDLGAPSAAIVGDDIDVGCRLRLRPRAYGILVRTDSARRTSPRSRVKPDAVVRSFAEVPALLPPKRETALRD